MGLISQHPWAEEKGVKEKKRKMQVRKEAGDGDDECEELKPTEAII